MKKADILWYNSSTGETQVWYMDGHRRVGRGTVVDEDGNFIPIGPPFSIVGTGMFGPGTPSRPQGPTGLRVTDVADRKISVAWIGHSDNEDGFRVRFRGKRAGVSDHTGTKSVGRNEVSASLTGLRSNYEYTISVVAFHAGGESQRSNEVRATTPARSISVSKEGAGTSTVFVVRAGFTPSSRA